MNSITFTPRTEGMTWNQRKDFVAEWLDEAYNLGHLRDQRFGTHAFVQQIINLAPRAGLRLWKPGSKRGTKMNQMSLGTNNVQRLRRRVAGTSHQNLDLIEFGLQYILGVPAPEKASEVGVTPFVDEPIPATTAEVIVPAEKTVSSNDEPVLISRETATLALSVLMESIQNGVEILTYAKAISEIAGEMETV